MKILFIGGTGNISSAVSKKLIADGHQLTLYNRKSPLSGAIHIAGDIGNERETSAKLGQQYWDVVVNWIGFTAKDAERDVRLFSGKCKQYIFISSASCYNNPGDGQAIKESLELGNPYWDYSRAKIAAEKSLFLAHQTQDFPLTVVRPSHTYSRVIPLTIGAWTDYNTIMRMKHNKPIIVQDDGESLWTLTHASDFAKGFIGLLGNTYALGEAVHITSDEVLSWNTIYQQTATALGVKANIVHIPTKDIVKVMPEEKGSLLGDKAVTSRFDNSKIKQLVPSFKASIRFSEGIKETLEWFEADKARQVIDADIETKIEQLLKSQTT